MSKSETTPEAIAFNATELHQIRQWFDAVQDINPQYLERRDYLLAKRIYLHFSRYVPQSIEREIARG